MNSEAAARLRVRWARRSRSPRRPLTSSSRVRSRQARATPTAIPGHQRAGVVERLHDAGEAALGFDLRAPEQVLARDAAVVEDEVGGVGGADAELVLEPVELQPGVVALDHERLDRGAALAAVERGPHHDQLGAVARGDEDLLAVEHVLARLLVQRGGGADRGGVRAGLGLGDRHRGPLAAEALQLLLVGHGGDRGLAEALAGIVSSRPTSPQHSSISPSRLAMFEPLRLSPRSSFAPPEPFEPTPPAPAPLSAPPSFMPSMTAASMSSSLG